jgi:ankyrin repeat protein
VQQLAQVITISHLFLSLTTLGTYQGHGVELMAARVGQTSVLKYLVEEMGGRCDAADNDGATVLHWAIIAGADALAIWLMEAKGRGGYCISCAPSIERIIHSLR